MARFFMAVMAAATLVACSPGSSEGDSCTNPQDCQAQLVCIFNPGVCKHTCLADSQCSDGQTCQCTGSLQHCDHRLPDGGIGDAGCGG
jgi:hypothetical protein